MPDDPRAVLRAGHTVADRLKDALDRLDAVMEDFNEHPGSPEHSERAREAMANVRAAMAQATEFVDAPASPSTHPNRKDDHA